MSTAIGDTRPEKNTELAHTVRRLYLTLLKQRKGAVKWSHVKGHSEHKWNNVADELADAGASEKDGDRMGGNNWMRARIDGAWASSGAAMVQLAETKHEVNRTQDGVVVKRTTTRTSETQNEWGVLPNKDPRNENQKPSKWLDEINRINRATNEFGTLNLVYDAKTWSNTEVKQAWEETVTCVKSAITERDTKGRNKDEATKTMEKLTNNSRASQRTLTGD